MCKSYKHHSFTGFLPFNRYQDCWKINKTSLGEWGQRKKEEKKHTPKSIEVEEACGNKGKWGPPGTYRTTPMSPISLRSQDSSEYSMHLQDEYFKTTEIENVGFGWDAYEPLLNLLFSNSSSTAWLFEPKIMSDIGPLVLKLGPSLSRRTPLGSLRRDSWLCQEGRHVSHEIIVSNCVAMCWGCRITAAHELLSKH